MITKLLFFLLFKLPSAQAEYRAFQLEITNVETQTARTINSTLDQFQYPQYYPLNRNEVIKLVDHWMCRGDTSHFKPICPKPTPELNAEM